MADNYLEKRMEDLRNGRVVTGCSRTSGSAGLRLSFPFKALRVLIFAGNRYYIYQYAEVFRRIGCKVAFISERLSENTDLGENHGIRYYSLKSISLDSAFDKLIHAWRDIDVVVKLDDISGIGQLLSEHAASMPYPNEWGMPVLVIENATVHRGDIIIKRPIVDEPGRNESKVLPYLCLKENSCIKEIDF